MSTSLRHSFHRFFLTRASALPLTLALVACGGPGLEESFVTMESSGTAPSVVIRDTPWDAQPQDTTPSVVIRDTPWDAQPEGSTPWDLTGEEPVISGLSAEALRRSIASEQPSVIIRDPRSAGIPCYVARVEGLEQPAMVCLVER
ncbi:MAG TPA: hypothetical protein VF815_41615 [Myxococcaceae bacterium]|jgi:hypothetical protein